LDKNNQPSKYLWGRLTSEVWVRHSLLLIFWCYNPVMFSTA